MIGEAAIGWDLDRMAVVDRNVLRLATAELLACDDVPDRGDPQRGRRPGLGLLDRRLGPVRERRAGHRRRDGARLITYQWTGY